MPGSNSEIRRRLSESIGSNIMVQYSVGPIVSYHGRITAREYTGRLGNQVHSRDPDVIYEDDNAPFTQLQLFSHNLKSMIQTS
jgi:hypothetical protein